MMSNEELGWVVITSSMVMGISVCLGVCLVMWCRRFSGGTNKISPVAILDPMSQKNGMPPSHASLLLPSVTRSEFGSEPRTPSSSASHLSQHSRSYWSIGQSPTADGLQKNPYTTYGTPVGLRDVYVPYNAALSQHRLYQIPPKYSTTHSSNYSFVKNFHERRAGQEASSPSEQLPMVPSVKHNFRPQPRNDAFTSPLDSDTSESITSVPLERLTGRDTHQGMVKEVHRRSVKKENGIKSRRSTKLHRDDSMMSSFEKEALEAVSKRLEELSLTSQENFANVSRVHNQPISLSTGIKLDQIPYISSSIGSSPSRMSPRNRTHYKTRVSSPPGNDVISQLGIESNLSPMTPSSEEVAQPSTSERRISHMSLKDDDLPLSKSIEDLQSSAVLTKTEPTSGFLGSLEIQLKYHSAQEQLIIRILSVRNVPARYMSPGSKLYVKVLIDGVSKYTTPLVRAREPITFQNTIAHSISSTNLAGATIRFSMCQPQSDSRHRRIVVGYVNLHPVGLWPILYLNTTLTHNLTTQSLLLNLSDSTPDHQIVCSGCVTFGLLLSKDMQDITVTSVTLQKLTAIEIAENAPVYVKVSFYRGSELVTWKRSKPTLLNKQRTHLTHQLELRVTTSQAADNDSDLGATRDEAGQKENLAEEIDDKDNIPSLVADDKILIVLSVRLKTMKRGGRCVLGSVFLGETAPTEDGRSHWRRAVAQALLEVPAAGSHTLSHSS